MNHGLRENGLETLKEGEGGEGDGCLELGAMKGVCDENGKSSLGMS
jgi:hypothetical protein